MLKRRKIVVTKKEVEDISNYLWGLSECVYGLVCIVQKFLENPKLSKELHSRYICILNDIKEKELYRPGGIVFEEFEPPFNLLSNPCLSEKQKDRVYEELEKFQVFVLEIENKRHEILGKEYKAQTGISDSDLKSFLDSLPNPKLEASDKTMKIELVGTPTIQTKQEKEGVLVKGKKKITLQCFPRTEWSMVKITFLDDRNIILSDGKENKPSNFYAIGCGDGRDENSRPDKNWEFLLRLSKNDNNFQTLNIKERRRMGKQKQKIVDILRKLFDNDTLPFEKGKGRIFVPKFKIEYNEPELPTIRTSQKEFLDLGPVYSEMTKSSQENLEQESRDSSHSEDFSLYD